MIRFLSITIILFIGFPMLLLAQHGKSIIKKIAPTLSADQSIAGVRVYINDRNDFTHWVKEKLPHVRVTEQSKNVF